MNKVILFTDLTTEEALLKIESDAKKYEGLYVDMNDKKQRKYVKDSATAINDLLKKIERARIDKSKEYKIQVETEAKQIKERLEAANSPFSDLINGYNEERAKILAEEKRKQQEVIDALHYERDYDEAGQLNRLFDLELKEAEQIKIAEEQARVEREKQIAEQAAAQAKEEAAKQIIKQKEESEAREAKAKQDILDAEERTKQAEVKAKADAEKAKLEAEQEMKRQQEQAELDKQAAINAEIARQEAEKKREQEEAAAREANTSHKRKINNEAMQCFIAGGLSEEDSKKAVKLLAKGSIKNVKITY